MSGSDPTGEPVGLSSQEAARRQQTVGRNELPSVRENPLQRLLRKFTGAVPYLLELALALEIWMGKWIDAGVIAALLVFNAALSTHQEGKAEKALALLRERLPVMARVLRDGAWGRRPAAELVPDDVVELRMGDQVPADLRVLKSSVLRLDQSSLTGESLPVERREGDTLFAGTSVVHGEALGVVVATGPRTSFGRTAEIVRKAEAPSRLEQLVLKLVRSLVIYASILLVLVAGVALLRGIGWLTLVPFALVLLVVSIPVALPATFTLANAVGATELAQADILVTGLAAVEEAATMTTLFSDKTGTLTQNRLEVTALDPSPGETSTRLVQLAAGVADEATQDPIDVSILSRATAMGIPRLSVRERVPFEPGTKRAEAVLVGEDGTLRAALGSPQVVGGLCAEPLPSLQERVDRLARDGRRVLAVAATRGGQFRLVGLIGLSDPPRPTSAAVVRRLRELGIRVVMVTGDAVETARAIARQLGLGDRVATREAFAESPESADVLAGIYPEDKFQVVRTAQAHGEVVGMTGDGVNDAPAIRQADVGIAVANATDVAKASARLVLTRPGIDGVVPAVVTGRRVYQRLQTYTLVKVVKVLEIGTLLSLGVLWAGQFWTTPRLILFLVFANDFVTMSLAEDRVHPSSRPNRWDVRSLVEVGALLAGSWLLLSVLLILVIAPALHLGLPAIQTLVFLDQVYLVQATVLLMRTKDPLWTSRPGRFVSLSTVAVIGVATGLALVGLGMAALPVAAVLDLAILVTGTTVLLDFAKRTFQGHLDGSGSPSPT